MGEEENKFEKKLKVINQREKIDKLEYKLELEKSKLEYLEQRAKEDEEKFTEKEQRDLEKLEQRQVKKKENLEKKKEAKIKNRALNEPPVRSTLEEVGNSVTHGVGAIFAIVAIILLLLHSTTPLMVMGSLFYGISIFLMMLASCLYHAFKSKSTVKRIFRRFDYTGIYLLIGGTFAPIWLIDRGNVFGITMFCIQWVAIITGITFVGVFGPGRFRWLHFTLFFVIGWSGLMFIPLWIIDGNLTLLFMILGGGIVYTIGMIPFVMNKKSAHFIWHFFVLFGCIAHFIGIYLCIYLNIFG